MQNDNPPTLPPWQQLQVMVLYHLAAPERLVELIAALDSWIEASGTTLDRALDQGRDRAFSDPRWGVRDTPSNWSSHGYGLLLDFRKSTAEALALREAEIYRMTGLNGCIRGLQELSLEWMTPDEEHDFQAQIRSVERLAAPLDAVFARPCQLNDFELTGLVSDLSEHLTTGARLKLHPEIRIESGQRPSRTGVYVPAELPAASPQFLWSGDEFGAPGPAWTFNSTGDAALQHVGRPELWVNKAQMAKFAAHAVANGLMSVQPPFEAQDVSDADVAGSLVAMQAFEARPSEWIFVELLESDPDEQASTRVDNSTASDAAKRLEAYAGQTCPRTGWWRTAARLGERRYIEMGKPMPDIQSRTHGVIIWYFDDDQRDTL